MCNSQLTVFHVVNPGKLEVLLGFTSDDIWHELANRSLDEARELLVSRKRDDVEIKSSLEQHCEEFLAGEAGQPLLSYEVKVDMGEPLEKILEEAHSGGYDLLVISKHGNRESVKDAVMGDTARRVVRRCEIPVMVVPLSE